ncbi:MAG: hypothetical protein JSR69_19650 [Proteobacteria bacterium]|nr:hypothetical protein [Pseudomonadota bacterium]
MHFELILPGLDWPTGPGHHPADDLALPALSKLLGFANVAWTPRSTPETLLAERFGLTDRLPHARFRRLGESTPAPADGHWLCCDPVHLHFSRDTLLLNDAGGLDITREEADALMDGLNKTFADIGHFEAPAPDRWYIRLAAEPQPAFHPLADVNGRPVQLFLPEGEEVPRWARLSNELEVWLFSHPVNAAREERGQRTINGIWLWGNGTASAASPPAWSAIQARQAFARGLACHFSLAPAAADRYLRPDGNGLALVDDLQRPLLHQDRELWRNALQALESNWFAPLLADLKARRLEAVRISVPSDRNSLQLDIASKGLWKFWRKPRPLASALASAPQSAAQTP